MAEDQRKLGGAEGDGQIKDYAQMARADYWGNPAYRVVIPQGVSLPIGSDGFQTVDMTRETQAWYSLNVEDIENKGNSLTVNLMPSGDIARDALAPTTVHIGLPDLDALRQHGDLTQVIPQLLEQRGLVTHLPWNDNPGGGEK